MDFKKIGVHFLNKVTNVIDADQMERQMSL